jgi:hypothetical protein
MAGFTLVELLTSMLVVSVVFAGAVRFAMNTISAREMVRRDIELEGVRWYIRDSLDCGQTFSVKKSTKLPLNCADFPRGKDLVLRSRPMGDSTTGGNINDVFGNTVWKLRGYCDNNQLVVEYAPRVMKKIDRKRGLMDVTPSDVALPRLVRPSELNTNPKLPETAGFAFLGTQLQNEQPVPCPPTNSFGTLVALARFGVQTFLNSMPVKNDPLRASERWAARINTAGLRSLPAGAGNLGSAALGAVQEARNVTGQLMKQVAAEALKRSVSRTVATTLEGVLSGKGLNTKQIGTSFTTGAIDGAAGVFGLPPMGTNVANAMQSGDWGLNRLAAGNEADYTLTLAAKIPLQMGIVLTNAGQDMNACVQRAMGILQTGVAQAIPATRVDGFFSKDLNNCLRNGTVDRFEQSMDNLVGNMLRKAFGAEYGAIKPAVNAKFDKIEADIRARESNPVLLAKALESLSAIRVDTLAQVDAQAAATTEVVDGMMNEVKADFRAQINAISVDPSLGQEAMLQKLRNDLAQIQNRIRQSSSDLLNNLRNGKVTDPRKGKGGVPVLPDPPWMDLFSGAAHLCGNIFAQIPERDYLETENSCPLVADGVYPIFAGRKGELPICCREVSSNAGEAMCGANEYSLLGGAECSGPGESLLGQNVSRPDVLPAFQGTGVGVAISFALRPEIGSAGSPPGPVVIKPHSHAVQGRAVVLVPPIGPTAITVSQVYTSTNTFLGGFLRASGPEFQRNGEAGGQTALCHFANKRGSRHDVWTGPAARHKVQTRGLCCPVMGVGGR